MPRIKQYGAGLGVDVRGSRLVVSLPAATVAVPPIVQGRYARNRNSPNVSLINALNEGTNQAAMFRTKEVFRSAGALMSGDITRTPLSNAADTAVYRFSFHTGPYTHALMGAVVMIPPNSGTNQNTTARLDLCTSSSITPVVATVTYSYGASPSGSAGTSIYWPGFRMIFKGVVVDPDTTYYATLYNVNYGRVQSCSFLESASLTEHHDGYLPQNLTTHSPILDTYRQDIATTTRALWRRGAATIFNYSPFSDGSAAITSTTSTNLIDRATTGAPSASTPGFTLDMTGKRRLSQSTGVPFAFSVCASATGAPAEGTVKLVDSSNATIAQIVDNWTASPSWQTVTTGLLPASAAKYDLQYKSGAANTLTVYAVSAYEYEA